MALLWWKKRRHPDPTRRETPDATEERQAFLRRAHELVADLPIPVPFDEQRWLTDYGSFRGRPIKARYWPIRELLRRDQLSGFMLLCPDLPHDEMYIERDTRRQHQQVTIIHECAHDLLGHVADPLPAEFVARLGLPSGVVARAGYRRSLERTWAEFEAETVARLFMLRAWAPATELAARAESAHLAELTDFLERMTGGH